MAGSESLRVPKLASNALAVIARIGRTRSPREACGLLLPVPDSLDRIVIELPNRSLNPLREYEFSVDDVQLELEAGHWSDVHPDQGDWDEVAIWHTHPGGAIGPSNEDSKMRVEGIPYLVVALHGDDEITATWF